MSAVERVEDPGLPSALAREAAAVKGVSTTGPSPDASEQPPKKSRGVKLRPLMALAPYVARYRGQALAALVALIIASAATLVVPLESWIAGRSSGPTPASRGDDGHSQCPTAQRY